MAKKQTNTISDLQSRLNTLMVKSRIEKTDEYNVEIKELKAKLDYIYYGINVKV